ncbi:MULTISPECIES: hypothetical protein [Pectobacterium]|uniref:hypothetical protein n=1 Tax=Pectobacterium TaxID=122277 RepID=UPI001CF7838B|nr:MULTISPECIES: hypothetical protein [Pectobacterium]
MKKLIKFTIMSIAAFSWLVTHNTTEPEKYLPANATLIINENLPSICRAIIIATNDDTKKNSYRSM